MTVVLAAIDDSAACRPVLEVARRIAELMGAELVATHVRSDDSGETASAIARSLDVPLLVREGEIVTAIGAVCAELDSVALAIGTRSVPGGTAPAGHVTLSVARDSSVPLIVVPPEAANRPIERILVALEHDGDSAAALELAEQLSPVDARDIVAIHVFPPDAVPPYADDPTFEAEVRAGEFLRHMTGPEVSCANLELRVGDPAFQVSTAVRDLGADLVVLAWHRDLSDDHAAIVRRVLETAPVPVVLLNARPISAPARP